MNFDSLLGLLPYTDIYIEWTHYDYTIFYTDTNEFDYTHTHTTKHRKYSLWTFPAKYRSIREPAPRNVDNETFAGSLNLRWIFALRWWTQSDKHWERVYGTNRTIADSIYYRSTYINTQSILYKFYTCMCVINYYYALLSWTCAHSKQSSLLSIYGEGLEHSRQVGADTMR